MPILAPQRDGMLGRRRIKRGFGGKLIGGPEVFVPARATYPTPLWNLCSTFSHQTGYLFLAFAGSSIDAQETMGGPQQVDMCVDKTRQHGSTTQVYHFRMLPSKPAHFVILTYRQNAPARAINRHGLRSWSLRIHSVDVAVQIDHATHCKLPSFLLRGVAAFPENTCFIWYHMGSR